MASNLLAMDSNLRAMASNLHASLLLCFSFAQQLRQSFGDRFSGISQGML